MKKEKKSKKSNKTQFREKFLNKLHSGCIYDTITKVIQLCVMCIVLYLVVTYTAVGLIPYIGGIFVQAMGITAETMIMDLFILWMVPCLFVILMLFVVELVAFKYLWKFLNKIFGRLRDKRHKELEEKYSNDKDTD